MPKKTQRMVYAKGKSVFELIDPDGHNYVLQAHDAQFPIESLAKLGEQMKQLPKGWQYRTRALTEDLVLDLGPDKTIYAVGDEFHRYYTPIAETKIATLSRAHGVRQLPEHLCWLRLRQYLQLYSVGEHEGRRYLGNLRTESAWSGNIRFNKTIVFPNIESQPERKMAILINLVLRASLFSLNSVSKSRMLNVSVRVSTRWTAAGLGRQLPPATADWCFKAMGPDSQSTENGH